MNDAEEIKKRIDIVEFIGQYLQLKKAGVNHSALCPFHGEKTPSFMVSSQRQSYKCFGCGKSGDAISFFMEMEGFSFPEALRILGERVGVQVSSKPKEQIDREKTLRDKLLNINLVAAKYYKATLSSGGGELALEYLKKRKIPYDMVEKFKIGYAPGTNKLSSYFAKYGFSSKEISLAGSPQKFKYRIIFPIFDTLGFVTGFSGRILENSLPAGASPNPKYLNTPETPVFHKSRTLYGLHLAKDAIRKNKRVVVVEGQMDVISSHIGGVSEVVATSGTALTQDHLKIIRRYTSDVIFAFDEDEAGQKAAINAILMALKESLDVKLVIIDNYKDVGELVENEKEKWPEIVNKALPPIEWLVARMKKGGDEMGAKEKKALVSKALPIVKQMQDEVEKAHYISYLAKTVAVPVIAIERALDKISGSAGDEKTSATMTKIEKDFKLDILSFVVSYPRFASKLDLPSPNYFAGSEYDEFYNKVYKCYNPKGKNEECIREAIQSYPDELKKKIAVSALEWDGKIAENETEALAEFVGILNRIKKDRREITKKEFAAKISAAESSGDMEKVKKLMLELQDVFKEN